MKVNNLYEHADGGLYCLLIDDMPYKSDKTGEWVPGVAYIGSQDEKIRATTRERWNERFSPVAGYLGDDESVLNMIRRANPGESHFDFTETFTAWHESEMAITGHSIELAISAAMVSFVWGLDRQGAKELIPKKDNPNRVSEARLTITTEDLQHVLQTYEVERVPLPDGFTVIVRK